MNKFIKYFAFAFCFFVSLVVSACSCFNGNLKVTVDFKGGNDYITYGDSLEGKISKGEDYVIRVDFQRYDPSNISVKVNGEEVSGTFSKENGETITKIEYSSSSDKILWTYTITNIEKNVLVIIDVTNCKLVEKEITLEDSLKVDAKYAVIKDEYISSTVTVENRVTQLTADNSTVYEVNSDGKIKVGLGSSIVLLLKEDTDLIANELNEGFSSIKINNRPYVYDSSYYAYFIKTIEKDFLVTNSDRGEFNYSVITPTSDIFTLNLYQITNSVGVNLYVDSAEINKSTSNYTNYLQANDENVSYDGKTLVPAKVYTGPNNASNASVGCIYLKDGNAWEDSTLNSSSWCNYDLTGKTLYLKIDEEVAKNILKLKLFLSQTYLNLETTTIDGEPFIIITKDIIENHLVTNNNFTNTELGAIDLTVDPTKHQDDVMFEIEYLNGYYPSSDYFTTVSTVNPFVYSRKNNKSVEVFASSDDFVNFNITVGDTSDTNTYSSATIKICGYADTSTCTSINSDGFVLTSNNFGVQTIDLSTFIATYKRFKVTVEYTKRAYDASTHSINLSGVTVPEGIYFSNDVTKPVNEWTLLTSSSSLTISYNSPLYFYSNSSTVSISLLQTGNSLSQASTYKDLFNREIRAKDNNDNTLYIYQLCLPDGYYTTSSSLDITF